MVRVEIWSDERYPDYGLSVYDSVVMSNRHIVEISEEELAEYRRVCDLYNAMQDKLLAWRKRPNRFAA